MTVDDLLTLFRSRVDDTEDPPLWTDEDAFAYMDYAQRQLVRALGGLRDSQSSLCTLAFDAGSNYAILDPLIMRIHSATIPSNATPGTGPGYTGRVRLLDHTHEEAQRKELSGDTYALVFGEDEHGVRPIRVPTVATSIKLVVSRLPSAIVDTGSTLEVRDELHFCLLYGMLAQAYLKQDAETRNDKLAEQNGEAFAREIAQATRDMRGRQAHMHGVAYGGI